MNPFLNHHVDDYGEYLGIQHLWVLHKTNMHQIFNCFYYWLKWKEYTTFCITLIDWNFTKLKISMIYLFLFSYTSSNHHSSSQRYVSQTNNNKTLKNKLGGSTWKKRHCPKVGVPILCQSASHFFQVITSRQTMSKYTVYFI